MRRRLVLLAAAVDVFELSAEVPACGKPEVHDYGPGSVSAYHIDGDVVSLKIDGEKVDAAAGDELAARDGTLVVLSVDDGADTVTLSFTTSAKNAVTAASGTHAC